MTPILTETHHVVETPDGARLATDVHRFADDVVRPVLLQRVPYGRAVPGIANGAVDVRRALDAGFVVVVQDCRGRGGSTGRFEPFVHEADDGAATLDWLVDQPFCDGRVGMVGRSYAGYAQWAAAATGHQALRAIAPMISGADAAAGWLHPDGVFEWGFALWWALRHLAPELLSADVSDELTDRAGEPFELLRGEVLDDERVMAAVPYLRAWVDGRVGVEPLAPPAVPALVIAGWFDIFARSCLDTFAAIRRGGGPVADEHRLVIGPWAHGGALTATYVDWSGGPRADGAAVDLTGRQLAWFRRWMPTVTDTGSEARPAPDMPRVRAFVGGDDRWLDLDRWPIADDPLRLGPAELRVEHPEPAAAGLPVRLDATAPFPTLGGPTFLPGLEVAALAGPRDQTPLLDRHDVVVISHRPARRVTVLGDATAQLHLDVAGPGAPDSSLLVCVRLCVRRARGATLVLGEGAASFPAAVGRHHVPVRIGPVGWTFDGDGDDGDEVVVMVTRASFPRFRPPGVEQAAWDVHLHPDRVTWVSLPVVEPVT